MKIIKKEMIYTVFSVIVPIIIQFIYIKSISFWVNKNVYGKFVLLQILISGLSLILIQFLSQAFDRFYNEIDNKINFINEFKTILIFINVLAFLIIFIYGIIVNKYTILELILSFLYFLLMSNYVFNQKVFLLELMRGKYTILKIFESLAKFIFPLIFYFIFKNLIGFLLGIIIGYSINTKIVKVFMHDIKFKFIFNKKNLYKYIKYSYSFIFISLFSWGISFFDRYFIGYFKDMESVAIYSILAMIAGIGQIIGQIYFIYAEPKIFKEYSINPVYTFSLVKRYLFILSFVFIILFIIILFLPKEIYYIIIQPKIINNIYYYNTFLILVLSVSILILHIAHHMYFKLIKRLNVLSKIYAIGFVFNLIGNFFIKEYGILAAAVSTLLANLVILILQIMYIKYYSKSVFYEKN